MMETYQWVSLYVSLFRGEARLEKWGMSCEKNMELLYV